jgi:serine/threonine-protein kinase
MTPVLINATSFLMGSGEGRDDERPVRRVSVEAFELGATQVTNAEYAQFVSATGHEPPPFCDQPAFSHPAQPVVGVSWFDAVAYCGWLSDMWGRRFRLPNEAEWECAARGGLEQALYPWGDEPPQSRPRYDTRWCNGPEPVAQQAPNAFGLYDICENVHEWCSDWYAEGTRRASRGGSWRHRVRISRCAARSSLPPHLRYGDYGFRVACDPAR